MHTFSTSAVRGSRETSVPSLSSQRRVAPRQEGLVPFVDEADAAVGEPVRSEEEQVAHQVVETGSAQGAQHHDVVGTTLDGQPQRGLGVGDILGHRQDHHLHAALFKAGAGLAGDGIEVPHQQMGHHAHSGQRVRAAVHRDHQVGGRQQRDVQDIPEIRSRYQHCAHPHPSDQVGSGQAEVQRSLRLAR